MSVELDHFFVCVDKGAPEAEHLLRFGLEEGSPNTHPGQGTANRRFSFRNTMIELLWVEDRREAQSEQTAPTLLWERWSGRRTGACPFGIIARPAATGKVEVPFPSIDYKPDWLPPELDIHVAPATLDEPMWVYMPFLERRQREQRFERPHPNGAVAITGLTLQCPAPPKSAAAAALQGTVVALEQGGPDYLMIVEIDYGSRYEATDFRPHLPLVFHR